jgi:hypothetical protein
MGNRFMLGKEEVGNSSYHISKMAPTRLEFCRKSVAAVGQIN